MYDFVIAYKKGSKHQNADTLSRPILLIKILNCNPSKDIFLDEALHQFVTLGTHPQQASRSHIRRIEMEARHYKSNSYGIWYKKLLNDSKYLKVPKIDDRLEIIRKAHLLGHFQLTSTYNRLKFDYYWFDMLNQIKNFIKKCEQCQRNEKTRTLNHPAISITSNVIFGKIQIDTIHGFNLTKRFNNCIFLIVDCMTSFVKLYPASDKKAESSAIVLKSWILNYGSPKTIISDRGTEFINSTIKNLTNICGIEHVMTAAYHPRANGKAERANQTLINSLRKHCENNHDDWDLWVQYIEFSYNNKINSTTGFPHSSTYMA